MSTMERILRLMQEKKASDLYLSANAPAQIKINGLTVPINSQILPYDAPRNLLAEVVAADKMGEFEQTGRQAGVDLLEDLVHQDLPVPLAFLVVGLDQLLVDRVADRDGEMVLVGFQTRAQPGLLLVGE